MAAESAGKGGPVSVEASEFAVKCLQLVDEVASGGTEVVITKDGRPVSRLVPCDEGLSLAAPRNSMKSGAYKDRIHILGDIISPPDIDWAAWEEEQVEMFYKDLGK